MVETADQSISIINAKFLTNGDARSEWKHVIESKEDSIKLVWEDMEQPFLVQDDLVSEPGRPFAVSAIMSAAKRAKVFINGQKAKGEIWPMDLNGYSFQTGALAFAESWQEENTLN
ncbi:MAG: hypothetical protein OIF34_10910 [Porticoccaceae bacterium]|nr:hypothetical protein [Porticoccaceae bacterium]